MLKHEQYHCKISLEMFQHALTTGRSVDQNKKNSWQDLTVSILLVLKKASWKTDWWHNQARQYVPKGPFIATQLNSTRRRVELCRYKRAFSERTCVKSILRTLQPIWWSQPFNCETMRYQAHALRDYVVLLSVCPSVRPSVARFSCVAGLHLQQAELIVGHMCLKLT